MNIIPLEFVMEKRYLHPYLSVPETYVGKGNSLQETIGGCSKEYSHLIKSKNRELRMYKQQLKVFQEEGISVNARIVKPEALVGLLGSHVLKFHGSQVEWLGLVMFIGDKAGVGIQTIGEARK